MDPFDSDRAVKGTMKQTLTLTLVAFGCASCAGMSRAERVEYGLKAIKGACALYSTYPAEVPRQPELDAICPELELAKATLQE
jgi:hypothetical protein